MAEICPQSRPRYIATLFNYKLVFTNWARQWHGGIATIKRSTGDKVFGAIYEVPDTEWGKTGLKPKIAPEISNASKYW